MGYQRTGAWGSSRDTESINIHRCLGLDEVQLHVLPHVPARSLLRSSFSTWGSFSTGALFNIGKVLLICHSPGFRYYQDTFWGRLRKCVLNSQSFELKGSISSTESRLALRLRVTEDPPDGMHQAYTRLRYLQHRRVTLLLAPVPTI